MYEKLTKARAPRGKTKLRIRKYRRGISGLGPRRSWRTKATPATTLTAKTPRVAGAVTPHDGAWLRANSPAVTESARVHDPVQSSWLHGLACSASMAPPPPPASGSPPVGRDGPAGPSPASGTFVRSWAGSTTTASRAATAIRGSSPQDRARHPKYWMMGAPMVTPSTGPPAPTSAHQPMAFTRSWWEKAWSSRAIDAAAVAAPWTPSNSRATMSTPAVGAEAVSTTLTAAPDRPHR